MLQQIELVEDTLAELEMPLVPRILVWNKIDQWVQFTLPLRIGQEEYVAEIPTSAQNNVGIENLLVAIENVFN